MNVPRNEQPEYPKSEPAAQEEIRPYGPGKFDTLLDAYVYDLDGGCDESEGDVTENGRWYGLIRGPYSDETEGLDQLNTAERKYFLSSAGFILSEDSQGFVSVDYYEDAESLEADWAKVVAQFDEYRDNEPDEDAITTTDHRTFYQYGKVALMLEESPDNRYFVLKGIPNGIELGITYPDVESAIRAYMDHVQFWPNVFVISDHGNAHRIEL